MDGAEQPGNTAEAMLAFAGNNRSFGQDRRGAGEWPRDVRTGV